MTGVINDIGYTNTVINDIEYTNTAGIRTARRVSLMTKDTLTMKGPGQHDRCH